MPNLMTGVKEYNGLKKLKSLVLVLIVLISITYIFYPYTNVKTLVYLITILLFALSIPFCGSGTRLISMILFSIGAYLMFISGAGLADWIEAVGKNTGLLVLLIVVPLLGIPLKNTGYVQVLDALAHNYMKKSYQLYWIPGLFSHILGFFMNIGSVPLTYEITARGRVAERANMLAKTLSRGTGAIFIWSPNTVAVALVLEYLKIPWPRYFLLGFVFAVAALVWGYLSEILVNLRLEENKKRQFVPPDRLKRPLDLRKLIHLIIYVSLFLAVIMLIDLNVEISIIVVIPAVALIMPAFWLFISGYRGVIKKAYVDYFVKNADKYDGEVVLFVVAGFFSSALIISGWSDLICSYIMNFSGNSNVSITITILGTILLTSLFGIHPMITVSTFATSLDVNSLGFSPVYLALILAGGWSLGSTISPIAGNVLVVANVTGVKPLDIVYGNLLYAFFVFITIVLLMAFV